MLIFNLFGPVFRFLLLLLQSLPGSKSLWGFVNKQTENVFKPKEVKNDGRITREELWKRYINDPEVQERMLTEKMKPEVRKIYFYTKSLKSFQYSQPQNTKVQITFR